MLGRKKTPHALSGHLKNYCIDVSAFDSISVFEILIFPFSW